MQMTIAKNTGMVLAIKAYNIPHKLIVSPTDISNCPEAKITVNPILTIDATDICRITVRRLRLVRNAGEAIEAPRNIRSIRINALLFIINITILCLILIDPLVLKSS
jgi:hypothetical protein